MSGADILIIPNLMSEYIRQIVVYISQAKIIGVVVGSEFHYLNIEGRSAESKFNSNGIHTLLKLCNLLRPTVPLTTSFPAAFCPVALTSS